MDSGSASGLRGANCIVTGGAGFIGSNVVHALVGAGARVRVVDALVPEHGGNARNLEGADVEALWVDIADESVADVVADADVIFSLAGQLNHVASMRDPLRDLQLNVMSHAAFLETIRRVRPRVRVVHASTRQVYGRADVLPVAEVQHAQPVDVNGVGKWAGEQLYLVHHRAHGLAATALRLTNVYGPRQRLTSNELGFLPVFVRRALTGEPIQVFGDGTQRRDVLHVDDVVRALIAATADRAVGDVFNVGHDTHHTLLDIANELVVASGCGVDPELVPWPEQQFVIDIGSYHTDGTKIRERLGWSAEIGLSEGLSGTLDFYRRNPWYLSSI